MMTSTETLKPTDLDRLLDTLVTSGIALSTARTQVVARVGSLIRHDALAAAHHVRRAEKIGTRDNRVMWFGFPAQLKQAVDICDVAYCGSHYAGAVMLIWEVEAAIELRRRDPEASLDKFDLLREILNDHDKRSYLTALGAHVRWIHLSSKYWTVCREFEESAMGSAPDARWRRHPPTTKQRYLISRILPLVASTNPNFVEPVLDTRGTAHDFIRDAGGNPRFAAPPPVPRLAVLNPDSTFPPCDLPQLTMES